MVNCIVNQSQALTMRNVHLQQTMCHRSIKFAVVSYSLLFLVDTTLMTQVLKLIVLASCAMAFSSGCYSATSSLEDGVLANPEEKGIVLVAGATGRTGQQIVKHLLAQDYPVRVLVRDRQKALDRLPPSVEIVVADIRNIDQVAEAVNGVEDVISAIGSVSPTGPNSPEFVDYGGVKNLVIASVDAGVDQFVLMSSLSATKVHHHLNEIFGNVLIWKHKGENVLRESGLEYTIVRPGGLRSDPARQDALLFDQGDRLEKFDEDGKRIGEAPYIAREDVAEIFVAALSHNSARNKTFEAIGVEGSPERNWAKLFDSLSADKSSN